MHEDVEPSEAIDVLMESSEIVTCPDALAWSEAYGSCAPLIPPCEHRWEMPTVDGECVAVGPRACPRTWDLDADTDCAPGELLPCPEGFVPTEGEVACVPHFDDDCGELEIPLLGGGCRKLGPEWGDEGGLFFEKCSDGSLALPGGGCERLLPLVADCPEGPFSTVPDGVGEVVYVLASSECEEDCGSETSPHPSIQAAIDAASPSAVVLVGPGTYEEGLTITKPLEIIGLCAPVVEVAGETLVLPDGDSKVLEANIGILDTSGVHLSGLRIQSQAVGIAVVNSTNVHLVDLDIEGSHGVAVYIDGGSDVRARSLWIHDTNPGSGAMGHGRGVWIGGASNLDMESSLIEGARRCGVQVADAGTHAVVSDAAIINTKPGSGGNAGYGLGLNDGATAAVSGCLFEGNSEAGVLVMSVSSLEIGDSVIRGTLPKENGEAGRGLEVSGGSAASVDSCLFEGNHEVAVLAGQAGSSIDMSDTIARDTIGSGEYGRGYGFLAVGGAIAGITHALFDRNVGAAVAVSDPNSEVDIWASVLARTQLGGSEEHPEFPAFSQGLHAQWGAKVTLTDSLITDNVGAGLGCSNAGTQVSITSSVIQRGQSTPEGSFGHGMDVAMEAVVHCRDSLFDENRGLAASSAQNAVLTLEGCTVRDTMPVGLGLYGRGLQASLGGQAFVWDCLYESNTEVGIGVYDLGSYVEVAQSIVRETAPNQDGSFGVGIGAVGGGQVDISDSFLLDNSTSGIGIWAFSLSNVRSTTVRGTKHAGAQEEVTGVEDQVFGDGVSVVSLAIAELQEVLVLDNSRSGIYYDDAAGSVVSSTIFGNLSYGLAFRDCAEKISYMDPPNLVVGNALGLPAGQAAQISTNPGEVQPPDPPEIAVLPGY